MPKREDEYWLKGHKPWAYCEKHGAYNPELGCLKCWIESEELRKSLGPAPELEPCPNCYKKVKQETLMWNPRLLLYECLNRGCEKVFAHDELLKSKPKNK